MTKLRKKKKDKKKKGQKEFWKFMGKSTFVWLLVLAVWVLLAGVYLGLAYLLDGNVR